MEDTPHSNNAAQKLDLSSPEATKEIVLSLSGAELEVLSLLCEQYIQPKGYEMIKLAKSLIEKLRDAKVPESEDQQEAF